MDIYNLTIIPMNGNHSQYEDVQFCMTCEFALKCHTIRYLHIELLEIVSDKTKVHVFVALFSFSRYHRHEIYFAVKLHDAQLLPYTLACDGVTQLLLH